MPRWSPLATKCGGELAPGRGLLESVGKRQHSSLGEAWSSDLQTEGQSAVGKSTWNRDCRQSVTIEWPSVAQPYLTCQRRRHLRGFFDRYWLSLIHISEPTRLL